jgi:hypothetical protein
MSAIDPAEYRDVRDKRRNFTQAPVGKLAKRMFDALGEYLEYRKAGVSREDAVKGIEAVLREEIPLSPFRDDECVNCDDTGFEIKTCSRFRRCGRNSCLRKPAEYEHQFADLCTCTEGQKRAQRQAEPGSPDDLASVGRSRARRKTTRPWVGLSGG